MCQLQVREELKNLKFSAASLASLAGTPGSYERENAENAAKGINSRIDWIISRLPKEVK